MGIRSLHFSCVIHISEQAEHGSSFKDSTKYILHKIRQQLIIIPKEDIEIMIEYIYRTSDMNI